MNNTLNVDILADAEDLQAMRVLLIGLRQHSREISESLAMMICTIDRYNEAVRPKKENE